jgi:hypothetical protein
MGKRGPTCTVCAHPKRADIEAYRRSHTLAATAAHFEVGPQTVDKHCRTCPALPTPNEPPAPKLVIAPTASPLERAAAVSEWCRVRIEYESARPGVSIKELAAMTAQLTSAIRMQARLDGSLDVTEAQLLRSAPFARVRQALIQALTFEGALTSSAVLERLNAACAGIMGE